MIVNSQRPFIQHKNSKENRSAKRTSFINNANLNQDSFELKKKADNIAFESLLGLFKKKTPPVETIVKAEKVISPEAQRLMIFSNRDGGTIFHNILNEFNLEHVNLFVENLQKNPEEFAQIAAKRTSGFSNENIRRKLPYCSSAVDIIINRAEKSHTELKEWDKLAASVIRSLKDFPDALGENLGIKNPENTLKKAIMGVQTHKDYVLMEEIIKSIVDITKNDKDLYADMLIHHQKDGSLYHCSAIKEAFNLGEPKIDFIIDSLKGDNNNLVKVFKQAALDCDDLDLAIKMTNYFQKKSEVLGLDRQTVAELNINTIYNALEYDYLKSNKNESSQWTTLSYDSKKQIISLVEDSIQNKDIDDATKRYLLKIFPEKTSVMQKKFVDLCIIPEAPIA